MNGCNMENPSALFWVIVVNWPPSEVEPMQLRGGLEVAAKSTVAKSKVATHNTESHLIAPHALCVQCMGWLRCKASTQPGETLRSSGG